jgi:hypothetical protein
MAFYHFSKSIEVTVKGLLLTGIGMSGESHVSVYNWIEKTHSPMEKQESSRTTTEMVTKS